MSEIPGVVLVPLDRHEDDRGFFAEILRSESWPSFLQANHSHSRRGVLRGLHYHRNQADLWYVTRGRAQVALADLRTEDGSPAVETLILNEDEPATLFIPPGVAHGYLALTDLDLLYWVTQEYDASDEFGIAWDDPILQVPWKIRDPILSERDLQAPKYRA